MPEVVNTEFLKSKLNNPSAYYADEIEEYNVHISGLEADIQDMTGPLLEAYNRLRDHQRPEAYFEYQKRSQDLVKIIAIVERDIANAQANKEPGIEKLRKHLEILREAKAEADDWLSTYHDVDRFSEYVKAEQEMAKMIADAELNLVVAQNNNDPVAEEIRSHLEMLYAKKEIIDVWLDRYQELSEDLSKKYEPIKIMQGEIAALREAKPAVDKPLDLTQDNLATREYLEDLRALNGDRVDAALEKMILKKHKKGEQFLVDGVEEKDGIYQVKQSQPSPKLLKKVTEKVKGLEFADKLKLILGGLFFMAYPFSFVAPLLIGAEIMGPELMKKK